MTVMKKRVSGGKNKKASAPVEFKYREGGKMWGSEREYKVERKEKALGRHM